MAASGPGRGGSSFRRTVKAVAWSFLGIRQGRASQEDMARLNPVPIAILTPAS